jgi:sporulation protein YlmC with PRC-barrel domain
MAILKQARLLGATVVLCSIPALAMAQTQTPPPASTTPPASKPAPAPGPAAHPTTPAPGTNKSATAPTKNPLIGLAVFSSDGNKLGSVQSVKEAGGKVEGIRIKTGGFLGFGGKVVEIPEGKYTRTGNNVQLAMSQDEVNKLPEVKDNS